jgi:hypothetical protein
LFIESLSQLTNLRWCYWTSAAPVSGRMTRPIRFSPCATAKVFFPSALQRASAALKVADVAAPHLDELDQLTIREVGGWKTLTMVQRYAHLAPGLSTRLLSGWWHCGRKAL